MPFEIADGDITAYNADAIVNPTDAVYSGSGGVDRQIHLKAGSEFRECLKSLPPLADGDAKSTPGCGLPCKYIIHTSAPDWRSESDGKELALHNCYVNSIELARSLSCESIAFPLIGSKGKHFPPNLAFEVAIASIYEALSEKDDIDVTLLVNLSKSSVSDRKWSRYAESVRRLPFDFPDGWGPRRFVPVLRE